MKDISTSNVTAPVWSVSVEAQRSDILKLAMLQWKNRLEKSFDGVHEIYDFDSFRF